MIGPGDISAALVLVFKMVICAGIGFAGGYMVLAALFDRKISGREAFVLVAGLFALLFFSVSMMMRGGPGMWVLLAVVAGAAGTVRLLSWAADRRVSRGLVVEDVADYEKALEIDPDNVAAHSLLGDTYRRLGQLERAIESYETALRLDPSLQQERYWFERLRTELERRQQTALLCPRCRTARPEGAGSCPECGRMYSAWEVWRHSFERMDPTRKAIRVGVGIGAVGVVLAIIVLVPGATKLVGVLVILLAPLAVFVLTAQAGRRAG